MSRVDFKQLSKKHICHNCVGESYLSEEVLRSGVPAKCDYCSDTDVSWQISELAQRVETAFGDHYARTPDQPTAWEQSLLSDREADYNWYREGQSTADAIEDVVSVPRKAAADVQALLGEKYSDIEAAKIGEETEFSGDAHYEEKRPDAAGWHRDWLAFERSLRTEARFFSRVASTHLAAVFDRLDLFATTDGSPLLADAGPTCDVAHLYRARVFQSDSKLADALRRPDKHLGSPPAELANAGRMNARGISVFYGGTEGKTAIAEVRPPVGSKAAVARFNIIRRLRLLDLTVLEKIQDGGSVFDATLKHRLERVAFLQTLSRLMTRPVMPDDEVFAYLATQAIADFLATEHSPQLDGIIFNSAQSKEGRNVVLFHKAARVAEMNLPKGTVVEIDTDVETQEGRETDYRVSEEVPPAGEGAPKRAPDIRREFLDFEVGSEEIDLRDVALEVDPQSVEVHHVDWVNYEYTSYRVSRRRFQRKELDF